MSKLGVMTIGDPSPWFQRGHFAVAKVFNYPSRQTVQLVTQKARHVVYRHYDGVANCHYYDTKPQDFIDRLPVDDLGGLGLIWELLDGPEVNSEDEATALSNWQEEAAALLHARREKVGAYGFYTAQPDFKYVPQLLKGIRASDVILWQAYYTEARKWQDLEDRFAAYDQLPPDCQKPVILSEGGMDENGTPDSGFRGRISNDAYLVLLAEYDRKIMRRREILGVMLFEAGDGGDRWGNFNLAPIWDALVEYIQNTPDPELPLDPPRPPLISPFAGGCKVTQRFGANPEYYQPFGLAAHEGIDLIPVAGDWNVRAVEGGVVVRDRDAPQKDYGNFVVIWNPKQQRAFWYCHLAKNMLTIGQEVCAGEVVGVMGKSGNSRGYHLHLGLRMADANGYAVSLNNGYRGFVNPLPVLEGRETC